MDRNDEQRAIIVTKTREPADETEKGNPFLLNLDPPPESEIDSLDQNRRLFESEVKFTDEQKLMPKSARRRLLTRVRKSGFLFDSWHQTLSETIDSLLFSCYDSYDPFDLREINARHYRYKNSNFAKLPTPASGAVLMGYSGAGKTTALQLKVDPLRQLYEFKEFNGKPFEAYQIPALFVTVPDSGNIRNMVEAIFDEIYNITGNEDYKEKIFEDSQGSNDSNIYHYLKPLNNILLTNNVGLVVLDEFDNLTSLVKNKEQIMRFITIMMNTNSTSFLFAGTEKIRELFEMEYSLRRMVSDNIVYANYFKKSEKSRLAFCKRIWYDLQILKTETGYSQEFDDIMYNATCGSPSGFKELYTSIQRKALATQSENITLNIVRDCADEFMELHKHHRYHIRHHPLEIKPADVSKDKSRLTAAQLVKKAESLGFGELLDKKVLKSEAKKLLREIKFEGFDDTVNLYTSVLLNKLHS